MYTLKWIVRETGKTHIDTGCDVMDIDQILAFYGTSLARNPEERDFILSMEKGQKQGFFLDHGDTLIIAAEEDIEQPAF